MKIEDLSKQDNTLTIQQRGWTIKTEMKDNFLSSLSAMKKSL